MATPSDPRRPNRAPDTQRATAAGSGSRADAAVTWTEGRPPRTVAEFETCLDASQLLSAEELRAFLQTLPADAPPQEAKDVARGLLRAGKLTKFQAT